MDLRDVLDSCRRQWRIVMVIFLIAVSVAIGYYVTRKPVYYANAVVGIAPANQMIPYRGDGVPIPKNGLLEIGPDGPGVIVNMIVLGFDESVRDQIVSNGGRDDFEVRMFPTPLQGQGAQSPLPLMMIEDTDRDAATATRTVELAAAQVDSILANMQQQAGVDPSVRVRALMVARPQAEKGVPSRKSKTGVIVLIGSLVAIWAGVGADRLAARRRRSEGTGEAVDETDDVGVKAAQ